MPSFLQPDVLVGRVLRPRGLTGELQVEPFSDSPNRFAAGEVLFLAGQQYRLEYALQWNDARRKDDSVVLKLEGIDSVEGAAVLRGESIFVTRDSAPPLPQGQYYYFQLLEMEVYTSEGEHLGRISEIMETGSNDVYVVTKGTQEILIPALDDVITAVDLDTRRMVIHLPDGLR